MAQVDGFSQHGFERAIEDDNRDVCGNLAQTRNPYGKWTSWADTQTYANCAIECCRQIINRVRHRRREQPIHQEQLLIVAADKGLLAGNTPVLREGMRPGAWLGVGGSVPSDWLGLLRHFEIGSTLHLAIPGGTDHARGFDLFRRIIVPALLSRKACIVSVWASVLWPKEVVAQRPGWIHGRPGEGAHGVVPFSLAGDRLLLNDTGLSNGCGRIVSAEDFIDSLILHLEVLVTDDPIWA